MLLPMALFVSFELDQLVLDILEGKENLKLGLVISPHF